MEYEIPWNTFDGLSKYQKKLINSGILIFGLCVLVGIVGEDNTKKTKV